MEKMAELEVNILERGAFGTRLAEEEAALGVIVIEGMSPD